jgi:hypothetical protein
MGIVGRWSPLAVLSSSAQRLVPASCLRVSMQRLLVGLEFSLHFFPSLSISLKHKPTHTHTHTQEQRASPASLAAGSLHFICHRAFGAVGSQGACRHKQTQGQSPHQHGCDSFEWIPSSALNFMHSQLWWCTESCDTALLRTCWYVLRRIYPAHARLGTLTSSCNYRSRVFALTRKDLTAVQEHRKSHSSLFLWSWTEDIT